MGRPPVSGVTQTRVLAPDMQEVLSVHHWNERLFSFRITRPKSLRFRSGEFLMIGLPDENGKPIMRAYSIASPNWADHLEFYSIKVPGGPLTSRLQHIEPGDGVIIRPKPVGSLVLDALLPGKRLFLFATGTGVAPFASLVQDPETYEAFDQIILTHTTRTASALDYSQRLMEQIAADPDLQEFANGKLLYYPTSTREMTANFGRITARIASGQLFADLAIAPLEAATDRVMICGSIGLNRDLKSALTTRGFEEGSNNEPRTFVLEKAFVG
ncbi:MAG: ferredoxin--NADP reductase [Alphaproteobacteria bacterium]|nr:ferredoxin--NADP reductase [Alphaproteobacteria bacterium]